MKPVIGVTCSYSYDGTNPYKQGLGVPGQEWHMIADDYISAIIRADGIPFIIPTIEDLGIVRKMLDKVDGLLMTGGNDIDPKYYNQRAIPEIGSIVPKRDKQDLYSAKYIIEETNKPFLGICRGLQVMNVALGGTLYQHLPANGFQSHSLLMFPRYERSHDVNIKEDSLLYKITKVKKLEVNSFHHQAADNIASSFKVVAVSEEDNVCEALELKDNNTDRFVLGVQWHPEMMSFNVKTQQNIINEFVNNCKR